MMQCCCRDSHAHPGTGISNAHSLPPVFRPSRPACLLGRAGGVVYTGGAGSGGTVYAASEADGTVLWTQPVENGDNSSPALSDTDAYVSYACGLVYAFDRVTGQQRWFSNGPCEGGGGKTPVYHSGRVYARDFLGNKILDAGTGNLLGTFQAGPAPAPAAGVAAPGVPRAG